VASAAVRWRRARPVGNLLLACVRGEAWRRGSPDQQRAADIARALATPAVLEDLAASAHFHGVAGYAHRVLSRARDATGLESLDELEALRAGGLHTHLRALSDLPLVGDALGGAGVPWLVVKGPVLAELHGAPDLRAYSDLDLVVPGEALGEALGALEAAGARVVAANWWHRLDVLAGEVPMVLPSGSAVDLHWHLLNERALRRTFRLVMPALLGRARTVDVHGAAVRTLDDVDTLLHLALHTAMSGANRLVWLKDVERILLARSPDSSEVVARAHEARLGLVVATILDRVGTTLGTQVPPGLRAGVGASPAWRVLAAVARRLPPPERARPGGSVDRLVSRATRRDLRTSAGELGRRAAHRVLSARRTIAERRAPRDGGAEAAAGRRAFLTAVERASTTTRP
jgi:hypothetical protein